MWRLLSIALLVACSKGAEPQRFLNTGPGDGGPSEPPPVVTPPPPPGVDAGTLDAGVPDAGPVRDPHKVGGLGAGPFSTAPLTIYGSAQGILEFPVVAASVDEGENLWVVTEKALYLMRPG